MKTAKIRGIYMDISIWDELVKESKRVDRSVNWIVADVLKAWIKNNKTRKARARKK